MFLAVKFCILRLILVLDPVASTILRTIAIPFTVPLSCTFLHLTVPLSAHNLFPLRLFLLYLKLFLVLSVLPKTI